MIRKLDILLYCCLSLSLLACNDKSTPKEEQKQTPPSPDFDYGKFEGETYSNQFFNLKITSPQGWFIYPANQLGNEKGLRNPKDKKEVYQVSDIKSANLFTVYQNTVGSTNSYNANIILVANHKDEGPNVKSGADYLRHTLKMFRQRRMKFSPSEEGITLQKINEEEFYHMKVDLEVKEKRFEQSYFATIKKDFVLCFVMSYENEEQQTALTTMMNSLEIN